MTGDAIPLDRLAAALGLGSHEHVAIVGGGGKTTTMYALAEQLRGDRVATTTTKMGHDQHRGLPLLLAPTDDEVREAAAAASTPIVAWQRVEGTKAVGVDPATCDRWFGLVDHVVIEADGSRRRPFKAPGPMEPVVPTTVTTYLVVMGADALGRVIGDQCHRPLRVAALADCRPYERLTPARAATVLLHERGFLAAKPAAARMAILITKVDDEVAVAVDGLLTALAEQRATRPDLPDLDVLPIVSLGQQR